MNLYPRDTLLLPVHDDEKKRNNGNNKVSIRESSRLSSQTAFPFNRNWLARRQLNRRNRRHVLFSLSGQRQTFYFHLFPGSDKSWKRIQGREALRKREQHVYEGITCVSSHVSPDHGWRKRRERRLETVFRREKRGRAIPIWLATRNGCAWECVRVLDCASKAYFSPTSDIATASSL